MKSFGWILCVFLFAGCTREKLDIPENFIACGHGGSGFHSLVNPYYENSEVSISRAIDGFGLTAVEVDVQVSSDGEFFLYHDEFLESKTSCDGCISSRLSSELRECRFQGKSPFTPGDKLITLEYLLQRYAGREIFIFLDLKPENKCVPGDNIHSTTVAEKLLNLLIKYNAVENCPVISSDPEILELIKKKQEGIITILECGDFPGGFELCVLKGFDGLCMNNDLISRDESLSAENSGKKVVLFNVKTYQGHLDAVKKSPWCLQSDNVELMIQILKEEG